MSMQGPVEVAARGSPGGGRGDYYPLLKNTTVNVNLCIKVYHSNLQIKTLLTKRTPVEIF